MKRGLLLINLGTPDNCDLKSVCRYLAEFLTDKRVIELPKLIRYSLVFGVILPLRAIKVTKAYQSIWMQNESPLRYYSEQLREKTQEKLKSNYTVVLGMRYGNPSIDQAIKKIAHCDEITILPLYPQYSSAATGSAIEEALKIIQKNRIIPNIRIIKDFFDNQYFIQATAKLIKPLIKNKEHVLFSYHGLPEKYIQTTSCKVICHKTCPSTKNARNAHLCYKYQCNKTTDLIAQELNLAANQYSFSFQSRVGKTPWIKPYTDEILLKLAKQGIKKLAIVCPSFLVDCLETLEEIAIQAKQKWHELTGNELTVIPCLNDNQLTVDFISKIIL